MKILDAHQLGFTIKALMGNTPSERIEAIQKLSPEDAIHSSATLSWAFRDADISVRRSALHASLPLLEKSQWVRRGLCFPWLQALTSLFPEISAQNLWNPLHLKKHIELAGFAPSVELVAELSRMAACTEEILYHYKQDPLLALHQPIVLNINFHDREKKKEGSSPRALRVDVIGQEYRRAYLKGYVAAIQLTSDNFEQCRVFWKTPERFFPFSTTFMADVMLMGGGDVVEVFQKNGNGSRIRSVQKITHPLLAQIHSVDISPDQKKWIVAATGYDGLLEYHFSSHHPSWGWFGWDQGYTQSRLGSLWTKEQFLAESNIPGEDGRNIGVGPALRPLHLNGVRYVDDHTLAVTFLHHGLALFLNRTTGETENFICGIQGPHAFLPLEKGGFLLTDTRRDRVLFLSPTGEVQKQIILSQAALLEEGRQREWLQFVTPIGQSSYAGFDSKHRKLIIFNTDKKTYRFISFPHHLSIKEISVLPENWESVSFAEP